VFGWVEIQADDVLHLGHKVGISTDLIGSNKVRFQVIPRRTNGKGSLTSEYDLSGLVKEIKKL